ncbi:MAG: ketoacyl-ACP synthase III [Acidimicrobiia bacterium]|nr:ketoacyl-ACP synthase III [Acidimicrobiia bacterium]
MWPPSWRRSPREPRDRSPRRAPRRPRAGCRLPSRRPLHGPAAPDSDYRGRDRAQGPGRRYRRRSRRRSQRAEPVYRLSHGAPRPSRRTHTRGRARGLAAHDGTARVTAATIAGIGTAVPEERLTNADLQARLDTSDEWIVARTGIRERRVAAASETSGSLAVAASAAAIKDAGLVPDDVDLLVMATTTPDQALPQTSALVHEGLGLRCGAFDVAAACAGFVHGLVVGATLLDAGDLDAVVVVGSETLTRIVDPDDRGTAPLFGDGAAAVVLRPAATGYGLQAWDFGCDGSASGILAIPPGRQFIQMEGQEVFRRAVRAVIASADNALRAAGVAAADVDLFVPHQANVRIIDMAAQRLGISSSRTMVNVERYGNTSAASVPLALAEAVEAERVGNGDVVLLSGFGAGMTWASAVLRWGGT